MKTLIIDAICGVGFPGFSIGVEAERNQLAYFSGSSGNQGWRWRRDRLEMKSLEKLQALYENLRIARDEMRDMAAPVEKPREATVHMFTPTEMAPLPEATNAR
jgi:hypothetical protein